MLRPSLFLGSIPRTASSITLSGNRSSIFRKGMCLSPPMYPECRK